MSLHPRVLLVAPAGGFAGALVPSLRSAGFEPNIVASFAAAKEQLGAYPDLLITELKLGAFNGLHLAIRAAAQGTPAVILGDPDPVLEAEAKRHNARYLTAVTDHQQIIAVVRDLLSAATHIRRSPRKQVPLLDAFVDEVPVRLLDVSYEGMRLKAAAEASRALPPQFTVRLPLFNFSCAVQRIWTAPWQDETNAEGHSISCGAVLAVDDADTALAWRALVDAMPGLGVSA
jgi:hypothetical protein